MLSVVIVVSLHAAGQDCFLTPALFCTCFFRWYDACLFHHHDKIQAQEGSWKNRASSFSILTDRSQTLVSDRLQNVCWTPFRLNLTKNRQKPVDLRYLHQLFLSAESDGLSPRLPETQCHSVSGIAYESRILPGRPPASLLLPAVCDHL